MEMQGEGEGGEGRVRVDRGKDSRCCLVAALVVLGLVLVIVAVALGIYFALQQSRLDELRLLFEPRLGTDIIMFKSSDPASYKKYTDRLDQFLTTYDTSNVVEENLLDCSAGRPASHNGKVCVFRKELLGPCVPENDKYGYARGEPCVLLKLNEVYGWRPANNVSIPIVCQGQTATDKDNLGKVTYYPPVGLTSYYYPYLDQSGYMAPLLAVHMERPTPEVLIQVECRATDDNLQYNDRRKQGLVQFQIFVE